MRSICLHLLIAIQWVCLSGPSAATPAPLPDVILAGERSFAGQLAALDDNILHFTTTDGASHEVAAGAFVRWSNPRDPVRRPRVLLTDGSELVADLSWTTDGSVKLAGDQMQVRTSLLGRLPLPRAALRAVLFDAARDPVVANRVLREMQAEASSKQDQMWLVNGDRLAGEIDRIDGAIATLKLADQSIDVPLTNLSAVAFRQTDSPPPEPARWALGLQDGTLLRAASATGDENRLQAKLAGGVEVAGKSLRDVVFLQNLAGGSFAYLSDVEPIDYKHTPYFDLAWPLAVEDVRYLLALHDAIDREISRLGRTSWLDEETSAFLAEIDTARTRNRWRKVSGIGSLSPRQLAIVRELWHWRQSEAEHRNLPPRRVLRDDLIVELAKRKSAKPDHIKAIRGMDQGLLRRKLQDLSDHIQRALETPLEDLGIFPSHRDVMPSQLNLLGQFLSPAISSICRSASVAASLAATASDVRDLIAYQLGFGDASEKHPPALAQGWRAELIGNLIDDLLAGRKSIRIEDPHSEHPLAFDSGSIDRR